MDLKDKDAELLSALSAEEGLSLIESVSIDSSYDGKVHDPEFYRVKGKKDIDLGFEDEGEGDISVIITDIFGMESQLVIKQ